MDMKAHGPGYGD